MAMVAAGKGRIYALLVLVSAIWGFQPSCIKWLTEEWSPVTITVVRYACMSTVILIMHYRNSAAHFWPQRAEWIYLSLMGATGMMLNNVLQFTGIPYTTITNCTLISAMTPAITALLAALFLRERLPLLPVIGIITSFAGVLMIVSRGDFAAIIGLSFGYGDVLCFLSQVAWATYSLLALKVLLRLSVIGTTGWAGFFGCLFTLFYGIVVGEFHFAPLSFWALLSFLYATFLGGLFSMQVWNLGVKEAGASVAAIFLNIMPVVGMMSGWWLFDETIGAVQLLGAGAICSGVYMTTREHS